MIIDDNKLSKSVLPDPCSFLCMFSLLLKDSYLSSLQLVLCRMAVVKVVSHTPSILQVIFYMCSIDNDRWFPILQTVYSVGKITNA